MDDAKKQELLASLNALDEPIGGSKNFYEPSFVTTASSGKNSARLLDENMFTFDPANDNPFNSSTFKSLDSSINSVKSTVSVDSEKKAKLMRELFSTN